jgi:Cft2 family RNA processing exonuclease
MTKRLRLHRLGCPAGSNDIEPSCGVLEVLAGATIERRLVIDCGAAIGHDRDRERLRIPDLSLFHDGRSIDAVLLTHAHHDHMGSLPALVPFFGSNTAIFMTKPTAAALRHMFRTELDATRPLGAPKPYTKAQAREMLRRIVEIDQVGSHELLPGLPVWVHPAGHISGACSFTLSIDGHRVHYTGDRCDHDQPGILGSPRLPDEWRPDIVAGSDCTYGHDTAVTSDWRSEMDRAAEVCRLALEEGRRVLIYTFALHRAGAIAHELQRLGLARGGEVFVDGSAADYAQMFASKRHHWCDRDQPLIIDQVNLIKDRRQRQAILGSPGGYVIIAPPGMGGPGGIGCWWRREFLPDPDAVVAFTGYVASGTDGQLILEAAAEREASRRVQRVVFQETDRNGQRQRVSLPLKCRIEHFRLGGHNDRQRTIQWFRDVMPETAILSHGCASALADVEAELAGSAIKRLIRSDLQPVVEIDL